MPFSNYQQLQTAIIQQSHRGDISTKVPDFIQLAEQEMLANPVEPLSVRDFETSLSVDTGTSDRFLALPTGYLKFRRILIDDKSTDPVQFEVKYRTPEVLNISNRSGMPEFFTVTNQIEFNRIPDSVYNVDFQYYAEFTPLSDANPTNSVLTEFPSIYLHGAMWALKQYTVEFDEAQYYYGQFINSIRGANLKDEQGRYGPAPVLRTEGVIVCALTGQFR